MPEKTQIRVFSEAEMTDVLVIQTKNDILKSSILERVAKRKSLMGKHVQANDQAASMAHSKVNELKTTLEVLEALAKEAHEKEEAEKSTASKK